MHGLTDLAKRLQGINHQLGSLLTGTLVLWIHLVSESASRRIECYGKMSRFFLFDKFEDIFGESEQDGHVGSFGIDHRMTQKGVIHLENQGVSVYQK